MQQEILNTENNPQQARGKTPYKSGGMFEGASHIIFGNAKHLRKNMTEAEKVLWFYIKGGTNGLRFRRQHPIGVYIADFYSHRAKLIIEVDGEIHNEETVKCLDKERQTNLENWGYTVIRFTNQQVKTEIEKVLSEINTTVQKIINNQKQNASSKDGV